MDREVMRLRDMLTPKFAELVYNGFWFSPGDGLPHGRHQQEPGGHRRHRSTSPSTRATSSSPAGSRRARSTTRSSRAWTSRAASTSRIPAASSAINAIRLKAHNAIMTKRGKKVTDFMRNGQMNATVWDRRFAGAGGPSRASSASTPRSGRTASSPAAEIEASAAYARGLARAGAISTAESSERSSRAWRRSGSRIAGDADLDRFEDVHSAVEMLLDRGDRRGGQEAPHGPQPERAGGHRRAALPEGGASRRILGADRGRPARLVGLAERYPDVVMPGYTHLQRAQCVLFAHYILSFFWAARAGQGQARGRPEAGRRPAPRLGRPGRVDRRPRPR